MYYSECAAFRHLAITETLLMQGRPPCVAMQAVTALRTSVLPAVAAKQHCRMLLGRDQNHSLISTERINKMKL